MPIIAAIAIFLLVFKIVDHKKSINKRHDKIRGLYGKKPKKRDYDFKDIGYHWTVFGKRVSGDEKIDDITWDDLEMDSVYGRINNCSSFIGDQLLYSRLHCLPKDSLYGEEFDKKVCFFSSNQREREGLQFLFSKLGKDKQSYYLPKAIEQLDRHKIPGAWKYRALQIALVLSFLPAIILRDINYLYITLIVLVINIATYSIGKMKFESHLNLFRSILSLIATGRAITNTKKFAYEKEFGDFDQLVKPFKGLSFIMGLFQMKKDAALSGDMLSMLSDYLTGVFLLDFTLYNRIISSLRDKSAEFIDLYNGLGEIDMAIAVASFRESIPLYCTPIFTKDHVLDLKEIYHPLIDDPVCNTVRIENNSIITGSNASGKSTFIKATAINAIFAQSIYTCMGQEMVLPHGKVITSMAVRDDLMEGESYYIKEIKYLKRIIDDLSDDRLVICLIDEILRGTNTVERLAASSSVLSYLSSKNCIAIVASHDIELTQILGKLYDNYYFTEKMEQKDITFDYKIYEGVSSTRNAIKLLEYIGFPGQITKNAEKMVED
ncbi:MAG TPA: hypothetical protein VFD33_00110 [Bacillota bacterium]|nr:hypothetical protein [Bacillota bacterium]